MSTGDIGVEMGELNWIEELICFADRDQMESAVIAGVEKIWQALRGQRPFPTRAEIDPVAFRHWLPYLSIMELHDKPLRVRYRLIGTEVARFSGEDFSGKWLHETGWSEQHQMLNSMLYQRLYEKRCPVYGFSKVDWQGRSDLIFKWALYPLGDADGRITHCLSVDDFTEIAEPTGLLRETPKYPEPSPDNKKN